MVRRVEVSAQVAAQLDALAGKKQTMGEIGNLQPILFGKNPGGFFVRDAVQFELAVLQVIRSQGNAEIIYFSHRSSRFRQVCVLRDAVPAPSAR